MSLTASQRNADNLGSTVRFSWIGVVVRIIAGEFKGRRLVTPEWSGIRPTSDRLRETMFNILRDEVQGATVLDCYAGTGAVGLEAMSRGASAITFVDHDRRAVSLIELNIGRCGGTARVDVALGALPEALGRIAPGTRFDLVLLDPPYEFDAHAIGAILSAVASYVENDGQIVMERARRDTTSNAPGLTQVRRVTAGGSALEFYVRDAT